jgi:hypothetical protein
MPDPQDYVMQIGEAGDLRAPPGSRSWAIALRLELQGLLHDSESSAQRLQRLSHLMQQHDGFAQLRDEHGRPFADFAAFCLARPPFGLGLHPSDLEGIVQERMDRQMHERVQLAAQETTGTVLPQGNSADRHEQQQLRLHHRAKKHGISIATQNRLDHLARQRPDLLAKVQDGEMSVYAAAVEAGILTPRVTVLLDPGKAARTLARKMTPDQLRALIAHLQHLIEHAEQSENE